MRKVAVAAGFLVVASMIAACGGSSGADRAGASKGSTTSSPTTSTPTVKTAAAEVCTSTPTRGGTLVYARQTGPLSLNPFYPINGNGDIFADTLLYQGLVMPDPKGSLNVVGAVAKSWTITDGGRTYTFHLRPGIRFSNGDLVTAADVKYSLDTFANPRLDETAVLAAGFKSVTIVNPSTVAMQLSTPTPGILYDMSIFDAFIVPMKLVQAQGAAFWNHPVGTGPFRLASWERGSAITFTANPYYWQAGLPYLRRVTYDYVQNDGTRVLDLERGKAQIADGIQFSEIGALSARTGLTVQTAKVPDWVGLWLNHQRKPFADIHVRQAMQYALDRNAINKAVFDDLGTTPNSILPQLMLDAPDTQVAPYTFDLAKAKKLMAQSSYPNGFPTTLQYPAGNAEYTALAKMLRTEWAAIGIKVTLRGDAPVTETKDYIDGRYDMTFPYTEFTSDVTVPDEYAAFVGEPDGDHGFYSWWTDPKVAKDIRAFIHTASPATRAVEWPRIQEAMLQQTPVLNIMDLPFVHAHQKGVCGTYLDPLGADSLQYTWIAH